MSLILDSVSSVLEAKKSLKSLFTRTNRSDQGSESRPPLHHLHRQWKALEAREASIEEDEAIARLRESPLLARIPGMKDGSKPSLNGFNVSHSSLDSNSSSESVHSMEGFTLIQIGPLPEGWFAEPDAIEIKFNDLAGQGYCSDRDVHVIAYDKRADSERRIYVEFPTHLDATIFVNKWSASQPKGFEDVSAEILAL